jgi:hypothetical protein
MNLHTGPNISHWVCVKQVVVSSMAQLNNNVSTVVQYQYQGGGIGVVLL